MRKVFRNVLLAIMVTLASVSCVNQFPTPTETGLKLHLVFPGDMPQGPVVDMTTKASSESEYDVRYIIEAYPYNSSGEYETKNPAARFVFTQPYTGDLSFSTKLEIMEGEYRFYVWVDYVKAGTEENTFYEADAFNYVKVAGSEDGKEHTGNSDYRDAFVGHQDVEVIRFGINDEPVNATIEMYRPVSKIVLVTTDLEDWKTKITLAEMKKAQQSGAKPQDKQFEVDFSKYTIRIHYPQWMPNAFNIGADHTAWSAANVYFDSKLIQLSTNEASLGFDYIFANSDDASVVMAVSVYDEEGTLLSRTNDIMVELERGKVTLVKGNFLMEESGGGVSIDPGFDGEFTIRI